MSASRTFYFLDRKPCRLALLAVAVCFSLGATDSSARYNDLNHRLMCTCGCAQILGECNHVGCPSSGQELSELSAGIAAGKSDQEILDPLFGQVRRDGAGRAHHAWLRSGGLDCALRGLWRGAAGHHSAGPALGGWPAQKRKPPADHRHRRPGRHRAHENRIRRETGMTEDFKP